MDLLVSASNDCTVKIWDVKDKKYAASFNLGYQVTCAVFSKSNQHVFIGGVDNTIRALNLKTNKVEYALVGHMDTLTGLSLSPCGRSLLSNAMDNTVRVWDVRPFVEDENASREKKVLLGV